MEHSHSSKPNTPGEPPKHNENNTQEHSESQPSKPLTARGRYTPKSAPAAGQQDSGHMPNYETAIGQAPYAAPGGIHHQSSPGQPYTQQSGKLKHSGLGITSFILAMIGLLATVIAFVVIFTSIFDMSEQEILLLQDPAYVESIIIGSEFPPFFVSILIGGLLMMGAAVLSIIGFILGCISLFMKQRRKIFGILGTIFNALFCFGGIILIFLSIISTFAV